MGSGSSKPKSSANSKANRPDRVCKVQAGKKSVNSDLINTDQKKAPSQNVIEVERVKNDKNLEKTSTKQPERVPQACTKQPERIPEINTSSNGNVTKSQAKAKPDKFESDSESEAEDISAVLEATRAAEQNSYRAKQNAQANRPTEYFPETYAQRLQREQYAKTQQGLFRQKTIYRNPDEWEVDENEDSFDVSKFKEANVVKPPENPVNRDIFSPPDSTVKTNGYQTKTDGYYNQNNNQRKENLPRYDTSEEALLAEIEQEFDL